MSALHANTAANVAAATVRMGHVPLRIAADVLLPSMTMHGLKALRPGAVLPSAVSVAEDLLLTVGGAPLCWGRFAAVDGRMVLRVVRMA